MKKQNVMALAVAGVLFALPATATEREWSAPVKPVPTLGVPGGKASIPQTVQLAQAGDPAVRVNQLEEQVRTLNGQLEEINFQLLQLQEQLRQMQEDNEFRFQELEEKRGGLSPSARTARRNETENQPGKRQPSGQDSAQRTGGDDIARILDSNQTGGPQGEKRTIDGVEIYDGDKAGGEENGLQPGTLGSLTFDDQGNVTGSSLEAPIDLTRGAGGRNLQPQQQEQGSGDQAFLQRPQGPDELYELGYGYVQAGDYEMAEQTFEEFSASYPTDPRYAEARFWLGESFYAQRRYEEAARVFLDAHKRYPNSRLGAQTLLKLASSLAGMNQRELACATFAEVPKKYPDMSNAVRSNLEQGRNAASCAVN